MKRKSKAEEIQDRLDELNHLRTKKGKPSLIRFWTGVGHRLHTNQERPALTWIGTFYVKDVEFMAFLDALILVESGIYI
jgi:hypothetical protein